MTKKELKIHIDRIDRFQAGITKRILGAWIPFDARYFWSKEPVPFAHRLDGEYEPIDDGDVWGRAWESAWFHLKAKVPEDWRGRYVVAQLDFSGEALVVDGSGMPLQGMTNASIFEEKFSRDILHLLPSAAGGEEIELWVEATGNSLFGVYTETDPEPDAPDRYGSFEGRVVRKRLCLFDDTLWHLKLDLETLGGLLKTLPEQSVRRPRIIRNINEAIDAFADDPANAGSSRQILKRELLKPASPSDLAVRAVGHAHIDTAWLWPLDDGRLLLHIGGGMLVALDLPAALAAAGDS